MGYQILQIDEVWHFQEVAQYDPITKSGGMFTDYINKFLKKPVDGQNGAKLTLTRGSIFKTTMIERGYG